MTDKYNGSPNRNSDFNSSLHQKRDLRRNKFRGYVKIANGKVRELTGVLAHKIHDNLQKLGLVLGVTKDKTYVMPLSVSRSRKDGR